MVIEGKEYKGTEADVAEYNDIFMRGEMGLDTDGVWPSTINVARKNYALLTASGKVKLTGNSIKSKKLQTYVAEFLDHGLRLLLDGKGHEFLDFYYSYVEKIYNREIPLSKVANKSRVKQSIKDYKLHMTKRTKSGSLMSRQAHMELAIAHNLTVGLGDTIHYVNNGERKSHGDVQKKNIWHGTAADKRIYKSTHGVAMPPDDTEIVLNCYLIDDDELKNQPDKLGEYNIARYMAAFNKRVEPLTVVFDPEIRDEILIDVPEDRPFFTKTQTKLVRGFPRRDGDQDTLDEVLTMADTEVKFWNDVKIDPFYMYLDNTIGLVSGEYVEKNKKIMSSLSHQTT